MYKVRVNHNIILYIYIIFHLIIMDNNIYLNRLAVAYLILNFYFYLGRLLDTTKLVVL